MDKVELLKEMDDLWTNFLQVRATYPYARPTHIGKTLIESPPYYRNKGLKFKLEFEKPLTDEDVKRLKGLGYWINQSVIIRLYALLEYYGIVSEEIKINHDLDGHDELDILRRLRRYFVHTSKYNPADNEQLKLFNRIIEHFKLSIYEKDVLPIPIDTVVEVIFKKIKKYIEQI